MDDDAPPAMELVVSAGPTVADELEGLMRLQHKIETEHSFVEQKKELIAELTA
mgnify:CR=1 FL=1